VSGRRSVSAALSRRRWFDDDVWHGTEVSSASGRRP